MGASEFSICDYDCREKSGLRSAGGEDDFTTRLQLPEDCARRELMTAEDECCEGLMFESKSQTLAGEEKEYVELLAAEKHQAEALKNMLHQNKSLSMLDEILEDVRKAADRLEEEIEDHAFDDNKAIRGVNVEAVLRVEEDEVKRNTSQHQVEDDLGLSMLIDSQNNQYILTKPRDSTIPRADHHFIKDIVTIVMLSLPCGWVCTMIGLPTMFGYIVCGVLLGPSGLNSIKSIVQVETLGEFGVFFTLFLVGLEFSPERLRKVWRIAVQGPCFMTVLMIAFGLLWGHFLQIRPTQCVFISTCLSLSSTPLVSRFLAGSSRGDKDGDIDYSSVLLGMLVMQDVQLSLFIAAMPTLIQAGGNNYSSVVLEAFRILALIGQILLSLIAVFLVCLMIRTYLIGPYYRKLHTESKGNKEILVMGISAFIFLMLTITELLDVSMELGCFLAGALISSQGHMVTEEVMSCIEPIRDFLAIIFFASIGLHVFPTFVIYELTILLSLTLALVIMKFVLAVVVLSLILPKNSQHIKWIVSSGLAQVSEFSFVLGSRARRSGIISREVYLLILSVTTLSLLLAPALWRVAIGKYVSRPEKRLST
ncbi:transmembrane and coiled-coil domain-containing protein 3 [Gastrophryne carolinensis]